MESKQHARTPYFFKSFFLFQHYLQVTDLQLITNIKVVYDYAKILNLKQFTTDMLANNWDEKVVYDYAKILNLKQFTTTSF